jgi:hypothetical protein
MGKWEDIMKTRYIVVLSTMLAAGKPLDDDSAIHRNPDHERYTVA